MNTATKRVTLANVHRSDAYVGGSYGPLAIALWEDRGTFEHARHAASLLEKLTTQHDVIYAIAVLGPKVPPPESDVREAIGSVVRKLGTKIGAIANVVEGQGFRASAMRSVLTGMVLFTRRSHAQTVCSDVQEACRFLSEQSDGALQVAAMVEAIRSLRGTAGEHAAKA